MLPQIFFVLDCPKISFGVYFALINALRRWLEITGRHAYHRPYEMINFIRPNMLIKFDQLTVLKCKKQQQKTTSGTCIILF